MGWYMRAHIKAEALASKVDRHAKSVAFGKRMTDKEATVTVRQYRTIAEACRVAAKRQGVRAHEMQAITWVAWRNQIASIKNGEEKR